MSVFKKIRTFVINKEKTNHGWVLINAEGNTLGRLAARIANILRGKDKADYTPHVDNGNYVVVINAEKVHVTGNKLKDKKYYTHSGYAGGLRERTLEVQLQKAPEKVIFQAVEGMLPKNRLAKKIIKKLKIYRGQEHPHVAQNPVELKIK
ncbi:MAG: 50S ribosomal protein L13 [Candidatus Margulisbacteria bacterium]|nr:50S ribosomal protein L13 [Candidatus Margulisiibacteriota bacterium]